MFIHLITICIGLIIAVGLQQIYDIFQRRRAMRKAEMSGKDPSIVAPLPVRQKKWPWER